MKAGFFASIALMAGCAGLAACNQQPAAPSPAQADGGVTVADARLALPPVKGNPAAVYFSLTNTGSKDVAVRTAEVQGAQSAMMHAMNGASMDDLMLQPIKAGETVKFEPGGRHVMVMGVAETLQPGGSTTVTLHFDNGDKLAFPARILAPGDAR